MNFSSSLTQIYFYLAISIIISSIIAKSKANGSEQAEEDGKLLKDKEENKVEEDE